MFRFFKCGQQVISGAIFQCRCHQIPSWRLLFFHFSSLSRLKKSVKKTPLMKKTTFACVSRHIKTFYLPSNCFSKTKNTSEVHLCCRKSISLWKLTFLIFDLWPISNQDSLAWSCAPPCHSSPDERTGTGSPFPTHITLLCLRNAAPDLPQGASASQQHGLTAVTTRRTSKKC